MTGHVSEGVIQYHLVFTEASIDPGDISHLEDCRRKLRALELLGQDPLRYDGFGFGNVSMRLSQERFLVSGSQTGHLAKMDATHYAEVLHADPQANQLVARGGTRPSSESLTHAAIYKAKPSVNAVIHIHDPVLWTNVEKLKLPTTAADIPYGTPAMAEAVSELLNGVLADMPAGIFAMLGHEDGIMAFGPDIESALAQVLSAYELTRCDGGST